MAFSKLKQGVSDLLYKAANALDTKQNNDKVIGSEMTNDIKKLHEHEKFFELIRQELSEWIDNSLVYETTNWHKHLEPKEDINHFYYTQLHSNIFGIIEEQVILLKSIFPELLLRFIEIATNELLATSVKLKDAAIVYRNIHVEDRSFFKCFIGTMIALANNMHACIESTGKLEQHISLTADSSVNFCLLPNSFQVNKQELAEKISLLKQKWQDVMELAIMALFDEIFKEINENLKQLFTQKWLLGPIDLEIICEKIHQYSNDYYQHLKPHIRFLLLGEILYKIVGEYIIAIEYRRMSFSNYKERNLAAGRLKSDSEKIKELFSSLSSNENFTFPPIASVLFQLADILDLRDKSLLLLEVSGFVQKYPDVNGGLLNSLILAREDVSRNEAKTTVYEALNQMGFYPKSDKEMLKLFQRIKK